MISVIQPEIRERNQNSHTSSAGQAQYSDLDSCGTSFETLINVQYKSPLMHQQPYSVVKWWLKNTFSGSKHLTLFISTWATAGYNRCLWALFTRIPYLDETYINSKYTQQSPGSRNLRHQYLSKLWKINRWQAMWDFGMKIRVRIVVLRYFIARHMRISAFLVVCL